MKALSKGYVVKCGMKSSVIREKELGGTRESLRQLVTRVSLGMPFLQTACSSPAHASEHWSPNCCTCGASDWPCVCLMEVTWWKRMHGTSLAGYGIGDMKVADIDARRDSKQ